MRRFKIVSARSRHPLQFETIISLDCHICPDVVQLLNQLALINPLISNEMIDGAEHPKYVQERNVQGGADSVAQ